MNCREIVESSRSGNILVIDTRNGEDYMAKHIPGSVNVPLSPYSWARSIKNWLDGRSPDIVVVSDNADTSQRASKELISVGLKVVQAIDNGLESCAAEGGELATVDLITPEELSEKLDEYTVLDVREPFEWQMGTIADSMRIPMNDIPDRLHELEREKKYAVICAHGNRSEVVSVYLADNGFKVANVIGGMQRWVRSSLPLDEGS
jgi:Rhodanese-related sulfurtransferase